MTGFYFYQWFCARLQYLQCISNGDTAVIYLAIDMLVATQHIARKCMYSWIYGIQAIFVTWWLKYFGEIYQMRKMSFWPRHWNTSQILGKLSLQVIFIRSGLTIWHCFKHCDYFILTFIFIFAAYTVLCSWIFLNIKKTIFILYSYFSFLCLWIILGQYYNKTTLSSFNMQVPDAVRFGWLSTRLVCFYC